MAQYKNLQIPNKRTLKINIKQFNSISFINQHPSYNIQWLDHDQDFNSDIGRFHSLGSFVQTPQAFRVNKSGKQLIEKNRKFECRNIHNDGAFDFSTCNKLIKPHLYLSNEEVLSRSGLDQSFQSEKTYVNFDGVFLNVKFYKPGLYQFYSSGYYQNMYCLINVEPINWNINTDTS